MTFFDLIAMQVEEAFTKLDHNDIFVIISGGKVGRFEGISYEFLIHIYMSFIVIAKILNILIRIAEYN